MPKQTLNQCPVCGHSHSEKFLEVADYTVSKEIFTIQKCNNCTFLFTNPRPDDHSIGRYYQSEDYISHHDKAKDLLSVVYNKVRNYTLKRKLNLINNLIFQKGNLLDIGCGTGAFAEICQKNGWNTFATEPDAMARNQAQNRLKHPVYETIFNEQIANKQYHIITMWHVLEHVHKLNETIEWLMNHLEDTGKIIIAVPNPESRDAHLYGNYWAAYDVPRHLYHFTQTTMALLMHQHNLKVESIKPMWFDSFYVSMLSTKYKAGKTNWFDSLKTGLSSNMSGNKTKQKPYNTSSLLYIITKK